MSQPAEVSDEMDTLYLDYATGALSEPARLLVDTHLTLRPEMNAQADLWEVVGAVLLAGIDAPSFSATQALEGTEVSHVAGGSGELPSPLDEIVGRPLAELDWRAAPGVREYIMPRWPQARLIEVGEPAPAGWTLGPELTLVLDGALEAGGAVFRRGDVLLLDRHLDRPAAAEGRPCLVFSVQDSGYSARDVREVVAGPEAVETWSWRRS